MKFAFPPFLCALSLALSGDIAWAPYSSTVFSAVTDEGRVQVS